MSLENAAESTQRRKGAKTRGFGQGKLITCWGMMFPVVCASASRTFAPLLLGVIALTAVSGLKASAAGNLTTM